MSVILGTFATISVAPVSPNNHGLLPFFVGILGGVTAYNVHVVPPRERVETVLATVSLLVVAAGVARVLVQPTPEGILTVVGPADILVGAGLLMPGVYVLYRLEQLLPVGYRITGTSRERTLELELDPREGDDGVE
jgi:hypothetical protein